MAITYVGKGNSQVLSGGLTSLEIPSGYQAGDLLVVAYSTANQAITPNVSGWTECPSSPQGSGTAGASPGVRVTAFYKFAGESESTIGSTDSGDYQLGSIVAFRGVDTTTPFNASAGSAPGTTAGTLTFPAVTTTVPNALILHFSATNKDFSTGSGTTNTWTNDNLSSLVCDMDQCASTNSGGGLVIAHGWKATAGDTGNTTADWFSTDDYFTYITLALNPLSEGVTITGEAASALAWINAATIS